MKAFCSVAGARAAGLAGAGAVEAVGLAVPELGGLVEGAAQPTIAHQNNPSQAPRMAEP